MKKLYQDKFAVPISIYCPRKSPPSVQGGDAIVEHVVAAAPNFDDLPALTEQIERAAKRFVADLERFLTDHRL